MMIMISRTGLPYHSGADLTLVYLRGSVVTWSEVTWSSSLASSQIGVVVIGTDFCDELLYNKGAGTVTSSSSTFLLLTCFKRKSFSRNDPFLATNYLAFRSVIEGVPNSFFWVSYEDTLLRFGFELISLKLFHISITTPNFKKQQLWFLAKPQFIRCRLNGFRWCPF